MGTILPLQPCGHVDGIYDGYVCGWIWPGKLYSPRFSAVFYEDNKLLGTSFASLYREDLQRNDIGDGHYAYRWLPPADLLDTKVHSIHVFCKETSQELVGSPITCLFNRADERTERERYLNALFELPIAKLFEKMDKTDFVNYLYFIIFNREPDPQGLKSKIDSINQHSGYTALVNDFLNSEEFLNNGTGYPDIHFFEQVFSEYFTIYKNNF